MPVNSLMAPLVGYLVLLSNPFTILKKTNLPQRNIKYERVGSFIGRMEKELFLKLNGSSSAHVDSFMYLISDKGPWIVFLVLLLFLLAYKQNAKEYLLCTLYYLTNSIGRWPFSWHYQDYLSARTTYEPRFNKRVGASCNGNRGVVRLHIGSYHQFHRLCHFYPPMFAISGKHHLRFYHGTHRCLLSYLLRGTFYYRCVTWYCGGTGSGLFQILLPSTTKAG